MIKEKTMFNTFKEFAHYIFDNNLMVYGRINNRVFVQDFEIKWKDKRNLNKQVLVVNFWELCEN